MKLRALWIVALVAAVCVPVDAQVGLNGLYAGVGTITVGPYSTDALNGGNGQLGIQYYPGDGYFYVSRRGTLAGTTAPHSILVVDQNGALVSAFNQGPGAAGGSWGHRDGATDAYAGGTNLFFGDELGVHCYDMTTTPPTYVTGPTTVMAANGPQLATFPITAPLTSVGNNIRALEYDPNGNGGNGSFWTANFGSALVQFDVSGIVMNAFPVTTNPAPQWSAYGLAMNLQNGMLWVNSSPAGSATVLADVAELDPATGLFTGRRFKPAATLTTGPFIFAAQGGMCYVQGRSGPTYGPAANPPYSELAVLSQGTPDSIAVHRLDLEFGFPSEIETRIEASVNGAAFSSANQTYVGLDLLSFQYNTPAGNPGSFALCVANLAVPGPGVLGNTFNIAEFRLLNSISVPTAAGAGIGALTVGDGFGANGLLAPNFLIMAPFTTPSAPSVPFNMPPVLSGTELTLQAIYLSTNFNVVATNILKLTEL